MNHLDLEFIEAAKLMHPQAFKGVKVLEIGAQDVNGNVRAPFEDCEFIGIDWIAGKNVDIVVPAKETAFEPETFDVILTTNHLEHDPDWTESLGHNFPALKHGGVFIARWAGIGSSPHGPDYDPHNKSGYYPKSIDQVAEFVKSQGLEVVHTSGAANPYIGPMLNLIALKP